MVKGVVFSAIRPSGILTIGNYIGVMRQWISMQDKYECFFCVADLHDMTSYRKIKYLNRRTLDIVALYLACGIHPNKSSIFIQSHVYEHTQLFWLLNCFVYFGELSKMTQFKEFKYNYNNKSINVGLFNYPILMSSDILLYQSNKVPVGCDQKQHLELSRDIAKRFNIFYDSKVFTIPKIVYEDLGCCVMSLLSPNKKMSKSDLNFNNMISLLDKPDVIRMKIKSAVTDSDTPYAIVYDMVKKPGISNLLNILSSIKGVLVHELEKEFIGRSYYEFKMVVADEIINLCCELQNKYYSFRSDERYLMNVLNEGKYKARLKSGITLKKVYDIVGFL